MKTKILIADDHPLTRAGVRVILEDNKNIEIIGEAADGLEAISLVEKFKPDIVVMDITMPNLSGIDATREILTKHSDVKVIALSIHSGEKFVKEMPSTTGSKRFSGKQVYHVMIMDLDCMTFGTPSVSIPLP